MSGRRCHPPTAIGEVTAAAVRYGRAHIAVPLPIAHHAVAAEMVAVHVEEAVLTGLPGRVAGGARGYGLPTQQIGLAVDGGGVGGDGRDRACKACSATLVQAGL
jgi:hypothetical protein